MCNIKRINSPDENDVSGAPSTSQLVGIDIPASSMDTNTQLCNFNNADKSMNTGVDNDVDESPQQFDNRKQPHAPSRKEDQNDIKQIQDGTSKDGGGKKKKWDAFASLQSNYESSNDDDSADDGSIKDKEEINDGRVRNNNNAGWNAFASFEQNYESSDESESGSSSDDDSVEGEESDGCSIEDDGHYGDLVDSEEDGHYGDLVDSEEDEMKKESSLKINSIVECVDLLDSEDEEQDDQQKDDNSVCELDVKMPAGKDIPGKENNKSDKKRRSRLRKRSPPKHPEAYTIDIGDSDSELSEVESRPLPSPQLARQQRQMPSWERRRRSTPIQASSNGFNLKNASDYACMNGRNDLTGGSGTGVNGVRLAKKKGNDTTTATTGTKRKSGGRRKRRATSLPGLSTTTKTTTSKPTTKRRRKTTASKATSSKAKVPGAKRRRKRSYKKRSTKRRGGNTGGNAWAARERGVRGGQRRGNAGSAAPYMAIAKQEPLLANIGGASIQF